MHFQKQDMEGKSYRWNENAGETVFSGQPSRRLFDRFNGDQVIFIINFFGSLSDRFTLQEGKMIEYAILHHLPLEAKSELSVFNWIRNTDMQGITNNH